MPVAAWAVAGLICGVQVGANLLASVEDPGSSKRDPAKVTFEQQMPTLQTDLSNGDKFCPTQT